MRYRNIKKQFWFNEDECKILADNAEKASLNESDYVRKIIVGYKLKEKPDDRFYDSLRPIRSLANNINQIAKIANARGFIDVPHLKKVVDRNK